MTRGQGRALVATWLQWHMRLRRLVPGPAGRAGRRCARGVSAFPRVFHGDVSTRRVAAAGTLPATPRHGLHPVVTRKRPARCVPDARRHGES